MTPPLLFLLPMVAYTAFLAVIDANSDTSTFATNKPFSHSRVWLLAAACLGLTTAMWWLGPAVLGAFLAFTYGNYKLWLR